MPTNASERKSIPVYTGFQVYFPDAILAVAKLSLLGGLQHGQTAETLRWDRSKSGDECDAMMRHMLEGEWESVAWRAMAQLQKKIEQGYVPNGFEKQQDEPRPVKEDLPLPYDRISKYKWIILDGGFLQYLRKNSCAPMGEIRIECGKGYLRSMYSQYLASTQKNDQPQRADGSAT